MCVGMSCGSKQIYTLIAEVASGNLDVHIIFMGNSCKMLPVANNTKKKDDANVEYGEKFFALHGFAIPYNSCSYIYCY